uniref:Uncharacterized protein n=1 Tax=Setaria viridis TaxID=4556 RepID=A0A4U6SZZ9_SETVI|nr:hypothetical protein SEVIR_9G201733v2 [Setaria viridis]
MLPHVVFGPRVKPEYGVRKISPFRRLETPRLLRPAERRLPRLPLALPRPFGRFALQIAVFLISLSLSHMHTAALPHSFLIFSCTYVLSLVFLSQQDRRRRRRRLPSADCPREGILG